MTYFGTLGGSNSIAALPGFSALGAAMANWTGGGGSSGSGSGGWGKGWSKDDWSSWQKQENQRKKNTPSGQAKDERTEKLIHKIKEHELKASNEEAGSRREGETHTHTHPHTLLHAAGCQAKASVYKDQLADVTEKLRVMEAVLTS